MIVGFAKYCRFLLLPPAYTLHHHMLLIIIKNVFELKSFSFPFHTKKCPQGTSHAEQFSAALLQRERSLRRDSGIEKIPRKERSEVNSCQCPCRSAEAALMVNSRELLTGADPHKTYHEKHQPANQGHSGSRPHYLAPLQDVW